MKRKRPIIPTSYASSIAAELRSAGIVSEEEARIVQFYVSVTEGDTYAL